MFSVNKPTTSWAKILECAGLKTVYQSTQYNIPEDLNMQQHRCQDVTPGAVPQDEDVFLSTLLKAEMKCSF
jgi:hypothetical protein